MTEPGSSPRPAPRARRRHWLLALAFVLLFPVVGFAIGIGVEVKYQGDIYSGVEQEIGRSLTADERAQLTVSSVCADPEFANAPECADLSIAGATRVVAVVDAALGLLLLGIVAFTALRARRDRVALVRLFVPALYVVLILITVLVVLDGLLTLSSVYLGIGVFLGRVYPFILIGIGLGVLLGVVAVVRAVASARSRAVSFVLARRVDAAAEPQLHSLVGEIADRVGTRGPDHVLLGLDPEFYVTEADVRTPQGTWRGRSVYLSLPLTRILTPGELRVVLGHEMGHFRGEDTRYSERFYPVYRGTARAIDGLVSAGGNSGTRWIALFPAVLILNLFMEGFVLAERGISRDRELIADQVGVEVGSARELGTALMKLLAFAPVWGSTLDDLVATATAGGSTSNASDRFVELLMSAAVPVAFDGLDERDIPHPTDSHPALSVRLSALGLRPEELISDALIVAPIPAADALTPDREALEIALTSTLNDRIRRFLSLPSSEAGTG